jgi:hypothetical protein
VSLKLYINIVALQVVKTENMNDFLCNRMLKHNITILGKKNPRELVP